MEGCQAGFGKGGTGWQRRYSRARRLRHRLRPAAALPPGLAEQHVGAAASAAAAASTRALALLRRTPGGTSGLPPGAGRAPPGWRSSGRADLTILRAGSRAFTAPCVQSSAATRAWKKTARLKKEMRPMVAGHDFAPGQSEGLYGVACRGGRVQGGGSGGGGSEEWGTSQA